MEKIFSIDKILHFVVGIAITALVALFVPKATSVAFLVAIIIGFIKELYDKATDGNFDFIDLFATWLGGLIVQILIWMSF